MAPGSIKLSDSIKLYIDYKSPYAYLAVAPANQLARETGLLIDWLPYTLDIPAYLGSAEIDADGKILAESRNPHQWRRVKYSYMDVRREANRLGLTIRGPKKIFDSRPAHIGLLYAKRHGVFPRYNATVFETFFRRGLDIANPDAIAAVLRACGADTAGFADFLRNEGPEALLAIQHDAETHGVFGVPSFLFPDNDLYWGREHIPRIRERLAS